MYSRRFDHVLHISFLSSFIYVPGLAAQWKSAKKYDFHDKSLQHMVGCSKASIWSLKKKKKLIKIFHFLLQSLSLSLCLSLFQLSVKNLKPWLLRGVLIYHVLLQLMTIAIITLIKTIAQGTYKFSLISNICLFLWLLFMFCSQQKNVIINNITLLL